MIYKQTPYKHLSFYCYETYSQVTAMSLTVDNWFCQSS